MCISLSRPPLSNLLSRRNDAFLGRTPECLEIARQGVFDLLDLSGRKMPREHREDGANRIFRIDGPDIRQPARDLGDECAAVPIGGLLLRFELIIVNAAYQQRKFRTQMRREFDRQPVSELMQHDRKHLPGNLAIRSKDRHEFVEPVVSDV